MHLPSRYADLSDIRLHYVEAGEGPLVILLHGFPQSWLMWRHQIPALAAAGYRVVAPDMRGYNLSGQPEGVRAYSMDRLVDDVAGLIRHCGAERAVVAGHDWGAAVAWSLAMWRPELLERLIILNVPHPERTLWGWRRPRQLLRSWYFLYFQLPWLPQWSLRRGDYAALRRIFRADPRVPGAIGAQEIEQYVASARRSGLRGPINYYRALPRQGLRLLRSLKRIDAPTLVIWGMHDRYLGAELAAPLPRWVPNARVERIHQASHWVAEDQPARVSRLMEEFLSGL